MTIRIVTDSTCDLPEALLKMWNLIVVPLYINMDGKSFLDGIDISRQEFYESLPALKNPATTSVPGIGVFVKTYQQLAGEGATAVISIHISASLSNAANVAQLASQSTQTVPVTVIDGGQLSLGTGLLVLEAAHAVQNGSSVQEVVNIIREMTSRTYAFASLDTLEFLRRSGRVSILTSTLGSLLSIKPILTLHDGQVDQDKARTWKGSFDRLMYLVNQLGPLEQVALVHSHAIGRVEELRQIMGNFFPVDRIQLVEEVTPVLGAHIGPGAVGVICVTEKRLS